MSAACLVSLAEIQNDRPHNHSAARAEAAQQLRRVENMARHLLSGMDFIDVRRTYRGAEVVGEVQVKFCLNHVGDLVAEQLTDSLLQQIYKGDPQGIFLMQKLIGDCANQVAFDALNLHGDYTDFADLKSAAEDYQ